MRQRKSLRIGRKANHDLLRNLHQSRFLRLPFRKPRGCGTLAGGEWKDDLHDKKGGMAMNGAVYFAHGLILGAILIAFAWIVTRK